MISLSFDMKGINLVVVTQVNTSNLNPANVITVVRILLVPLFCWLFFLGSEDNPAPRWWALAIFALAAISDRIDGELARRNNYITDLGKVLDPIADKFLVGAALISLSLVGDLPWWVTVVILVRELGVTIMRMLLVKKKVIPASQGGKLKTVFQILGIIMFLLPLWDFPDFVTYLAWVVMVIAVALTVVTGITYGLGGIKLAREPESKS